MHTTTRRVARRSPSAKSCLWPRWLSCLILVAAWPSIARAQATDVVADASAGPPVERTLQVGIKEAVPFAFKQSDGSWGGISVDLWRKVAADLQLSYEFQEMQLDDLFAGLESGDLDVAFGALTVTETRESRVDFSHPYYHSGLGIAISTTRFRGWGSVVGRIFSWGFLEIVGAILVLLLVTGTLVYFFERGRNPEQFGHGPLKGIANGVWWAAVTMTTVGYGDRVPTTVGGRLMAIAWMFAAIVIIASFTASVTSTLTLAKLESSVQDTNDLRDVRVGSVTDSTSADYLRREGIAFRRFGSVAECLDGLQENRLDAVVYDAPILQHFCLTEYPGELATLPLTFERQDYAFALPEGSAYREAINRSLLAYMVTSAWQELVRSHLGDQ